MKNKILPIVAGVLVIVAILVIVLIPKDNKKETESVAQSTSAEKSTSSQDKTKVADQAQTKSSAKLATLDETGNVVINKEDLEQNKVSFLKYAEDSKIELIAIKGEDGSVKVSLRNLLVLQWFTICLL